MKAKSIKGKSVVEIQTAIQQSTADGFKPTLAIVFLSISQNRKAIIELLDNEGIQVFGATTNGEFTDEASEKQSTAILLLDMKRAHFHLLNKEYNEEKYKETATSLAVKAKEKFPRPAFFIGGSNIETDAEALLYGFEDAIGNDVNVFGGMAGDDFSFSEQFVFTNGKESNIGLVCIAFDEDKISINGKATCGWKPVGTERTVTKSIGNHVYTIDGIPALDITAKYGGIENLSEENEGLAMELATQFPLQLQKDFGDPVMRPALKIDWSDHSYYCSGSVPEGSKVRFSLPPDFDVMDKVIQNTIEVKKTEMPEVDALIIFSCGGRFIAFGPLMKMEIEGIQNVWNAPMAGMFSMAELGRSTGGNLEMHNMTTCVVTLKEK
jgi:hypothetical protein